MAETVLRARRRKVNERLGLAAIRYAALGWPVCPGARPREGQAQRATAGRACSCDRVGCPAPGAHPLSPAWQLEATADQAVVGAWWNVLPHANIVLATGRAFDVLDAPARAGLAARGVPVPAVPVRPVPARRPCERRPRAPRACAPRRTGAGRSAPYSSVK